MTGYALLIPELLILVAAFWALFAERLPGGDRGSAWVGAALALLAGAFAAVAPTGEALFGGMLVFDGPARFASTGVALLAAIWLLWTAGRATGRIREAVALSLFSATGAMLMAAAGELVTLVLALELATMPAYVLIGYRRMRLDGLEGALKYFLLSMLTSLVMLYGMSFLYGVTGTTIISEFDLSAAGTVGVLAVLLTFVGLFAKLSAAPFHYWAPDAYAGAEPWTVAFVSTVPKLTAVVALVRLTSAVGPTAPALGPALLIAAVASMVLGNLAALTQTDIRRMMAYSGVAHTGYLLLAVSTLTAAGYASAVFYVLAYSLPSLGVMLVVAEEGTEISDFAGLSKRRPADRVDDGDHARVAGGHTAARRVLRQAVPVRGRARRRAGGVGRRCGGDERRVGRLLPAHRARVVPQPRAGLPRSPRIRGRPPWRCPRASRSRSCSASQRVRCSSGWGRGCPRAPARRVRASSRPLRPWSFYEPAGMCCSGALALLFAGHNGS